MSKASQEEISQTITNAQIDAANGTRDHEPVSGGGPLGLGYFLSSEKAVELDKVYSSVRDHKS